MTKRDSTTADLASPRDLRMASEHETDVPMTLITSLTHPEPASGYTSHSVPIPMPLSSSSSTPNFQTFAPLQPSQWRQESSIPTPSRSMSMEMGLQTWWWKRLTRRVTLVAGPWNTSSMESWVMCEIDMEIKWTAGTKPPSWPVLAPSFWCT